MVMVGGVGLTNLHRFGLTGLTILEKLMMDGTIREYYFYTLKRTMTMVDKT